MKLAIEHNFPQVLRAFDEDAKQARFAAAVALNKTAAWAETDVRRDMRTSFDRPTRFFLQSLRIQRAQWRAMAPSVTIWFKGSGIDSRDAQTDGEAMVIPHIESGPRKHKPFELRLQRAGLMPRSWYAVPGAGAQLDGNGNMSRGQISQLLNVLGTYTESGYNKANAKTAERLRKGNAKKGVYGFTYWVNPANGNRATHLPPGVFKRVETGFGTSLKPILIFVSRATYRKRFDFYGIVQRTFDARFANEFDRAYTEAVRTAR